VGEWGRVVRKGGGSEGAGVRVLVREWGCVAGERHCRMLVNVAEEDSLLII
jgi:hypothetical protein